MSISRDTVGVGCDLPEQVGFGPELGNVGQAVPTDRDRDRQIQQYLSWVVDGQRAASTAATPRTVPRSRPTFPGVAASTTAPACETTRFAVVSTINDG